MYRELLCGALSLAFLCWPTMAITQVAPYITDPRIVRVDCDDGRGTAFRVGPDILLSANHVTIGENCRINGQQFDVVRAWQRSDFSIIYLPGTEGHLPIDCGGFVRGKRYLAVGYARGLDYQTVVEMYSVGGNEPMLHLGILWGVSTVIPGQSGGPIFDAETMRVVGIVNVYDAPSGKSGSRELKDTEICKDHAHG